MMALTIVLSLIIGFSWGLFGITGIVILIVFLISAVAYYIYLVRFRDHIKLSKILPEWVVFRNICSHFDRDNDSLCLKLIESYEKNFAWEYVEYHFNFYEKEYKSILEELELLKRSKEKDKNDKIDIIRGIFIDHYYVLSSTLTDKMEEASTLKYQNFSENLKTYFNKK